MSRDQCVKMFEKRWEYDEVNSSEMSWFFKAKQPHLSDIQVDARNGGRISFWPLKQWIEHCVLMEDGVVVEQRMRPDGAPKPVAFRFSSTRPGVEPALFPLDEDAGSMYTLIEMVYEWWMIRRRASGN